VDHIRRALPPLTDPRVLVSTEDDAGVYRISDDTAIVQTVDFFTPIVDDPYDFGAIAAANALSDVYAMGARPVTAMNLLAFPKDGDLDVLSEILRGGAEVATAAGVSIIGGHSIDDREPKYGMAVTGVVHPGKLALKSGARPGDVLVLTKPLGTGIIATAIKAGRVDKGIINEAVMHMKTLNRSAAEAMIEVGVRGATDITGFGLLGHLLELVQRSGVGARLSLSDIPVMAGVRDLASFSVPGGTRSNLRAVSGSVGWGVGISEHDKLILADAQTSGGLLIAVAADKVRLLLAGLEARDVSTRAVIGRLSAEEPGTIVIE